MIALDVSETKSSSKTILPQGAEVLNWLEEETGADAIISPKDDMPLTKATFYFHIQAGAVLVQIKHGADLVSSIGSRLNECISKMVSTTPYSWQRVLAPVGSYREHPSTGKVQYSMDGLSDDSWWITPSPPKSWKALQSALWRWRKRGGSIEPLILNSDDLHDWMIREEIDLKDMGKEDKVVWKGAPELHEPPNPDDPLQRVQLVKDGRVVLASIPGVGETRAQDLWEFSNENLTHALMRLTTPDMELPKGIGEKTRENAREMFGLDIWQLTLEPLPEYR